MDNPRPQWCALNGQFRGMSQQSVNQRAVRVAGTWMDYDAGWLVDGQEIDPSRLHQEIAVLAGKSDITEEIARFDCHIQQFREVLGSDGIIGRKLDFLVQELNREVNTMSSKSVDYKVSKLAVDMKTEIEKIREQVQNLQ